MTAQHPPTDVHAELAHVRPLLRDLYHLLDAPENDCNLYAYEQNALEYLRAHDLLD